MSRNQDEVDVIRKEIKELERGLQSTGSLRTATDVQTELDAALQLMSVSCPTDFPQLRF